MHIRLAAFQIPVVLCALAAAAVSPAWPQAVDVQVRVELLEGKAQKPLDHGTVVVWLSPQGDLPGASVDPPVTPGHFRMEQKNKSFSPHVLVVPLGSTVEFPN